MEEGEEILLGRIELRRTECDHPAVACDLLTMTCGKCGATRQDIIRKRRELGLPCDPAAMEPGMTYSEARLVWQAWHDAHPNILETD